MFGPRDVDALKLRQSGCHFADNIFKFIFLNENFYILIQNFTEFFPNDPTDSKPALIQLLTVMVWCQSGDKPLSETMMNNGLV